MRLSFAVVREDPELEAALVRQFGAREVLVVGSGGCTALSLTAWFPWLSVTAFDINPAQLDHLRQKHQAALRQDRPLLNVEDGSEAGLNQRGEFEKLFRLLRTGGEQLVAPGGELGRFFDPSCEERGALAERWFASPYWSPLFTSIFHDALLRAMFGPAATQHAEPGSYAGYFQRVFERGLRRPGAHRNPFLQHVFLGCYRREDEPGYLQGPPRMPTLVQGSLLQVPSLGRYQLFSLSNVLDWSDDEEAERWGRALCEEAPEGSVVLLRQLNNRRDLRRFFAPRFTFDDGLGQRLFEEDRSLFYERIEVGVCR
jgi:S-adenosylmethionine-diacylglycerol 3-amino-3-carboxypropyl transferase